ncbi:hypothetical protein [Demequina flava]|uniref:hypothetical protein n=1 Tax=Demequina flava TaxID=1095025 RepID=UPI0007846485|nr:hypothetical protein [Demequina flava]
MTALDPNSATRVVEFPSGELTDTGVAFGPGGVTFSAPFTDGGTTPYQPVEVSAHGFNVLPRDTSVDGDAAYVEASSFAPSDDWTLMVAFDQIASKGSVSPLFFASGWGDIVGSATQIVQATAADVDLLPMGPTTLATPLSDAPVVVFLTANTVESFFGTSLDGVVAAGAGTTGAATASALEFNTESGVGGMRLLGVWLWEGLAVSQADATDTAQYLAAVLNGEGPEPPTGAASTVGPSFASRVAQSIVGPNHGQLIPDVVWGAWMDDANTVIATTGVQVPHDAFGPGVNSATNISDVDAGLMPVTVPTRFGIFDAADGGNLVIYAQVTWPDPVPVEGDPVRFPPGALNFAVTPAGA